LTSIEDTRRRALGEPLLRSHLQGGTPPGRKVFEEGIKAH